MTLMTGLLRRSPDPKCIESASDPEGHSRGHRLAKRPGTRRWQSVPPRAGDQVSGGATGHQDVIRNLRSIDCSQTVITGWLAAYLDTPLWFDQAAELWLPGPVLGGFLMGIIFKMHPKLAPRGRGLCPRPLGASFECILNRIPIKNPPKTGPGSHIYSPGSF